ncbi:MAG TPA: hypothetical protein VNZ52_15815 [Candidatus Thermoplasmatota archaeon]|nr:hypothetical protein [Candidatus Thermoplasmatota archaeon]
MLPFTLGDLLLALVAGPLLLVLPGYLILLPLTPGWGHLPRAAVGAAVTVSALALGAWGLSALGVPYVSSTVWGLWAAMVALGILLAGLTRRTWLPLAPLQVTREHLLLGAIVLLSWGLLYMPRWDYALPLHVDEWWPLAAGTAMERQGTVDIVDPRLGLWTFAQNPEVGFHLFVTNLRYLTGADWLALFNVGPLLLSAFTLVAVWACGRREGYGLEAALVVAFLPTSVRVLGPQFFVPLALGLFFIPAAFLLFTSTRPLRTLPVLLLLLVFVFFAHPQSAAAASILIGTYALLTVRVSLLRSLALVALAAVPVVMGFTLLTRHTDPERLLEASSRLPVPEFLGLFGIPMAVLFLLGVYLTFLQPSPERLAWVTTSFAHLAIIALFVVVEVGQSNLFDRAWMHGMLTMSLSAAYALYRGRVYLSERLARPLVRRAAIALAIGLLALSTATAQADRETEYYHVITEEEHADFIWIRENVPSNGSRVLLDPWKGTAFSAITGHHVYAAYPFTTGEPQFNRSDLRGFNNVIRAQRVLAAGAVDQAWLDRFGVTLIYTDDAIENPNFTEIQPRIWARKG